MNIYYKLLFLLHVWLYYKLCVPISPLNHKYHVYLESNTQIEICSFNLEAKDVYWLTDT